jgi:hypothetical protein
MFSFRQTSSPVVELSATSGLKKGSDLSPLCTGHLFQPRQRQVEPDGVALQLDRNVIVGPHEEDRFVLLPEAGNEIPQLPQDNRIFEERIKILQQKT